MAEYQLKDSGVEWLGDIPEHWKVTRFKFSLKKVNSGVTPKGGATSYVSNGIPLIRSQNVKNTGLDLSDVVFIKKETHLKMTNSHVLSGDLLLNITGASIGRCALVVSIDEANVNQHVCILRLFPWFGRRFYYYYLLSDIVQSQIFSSFTGSGREGLSFESIKRFITLVPAKKEQKAIANYLDKACQQIDKTLEIKQQQLELLEKYRQSIIHEAVTKGLDKNIPMKDSGVEWLGNIPKHWKLRKISYLIDVKDGTHDTPSYEQYSENSYAFVTSKDIINNEISFDSVKYINQKFHEDYIRRSNVKKGDIVMPMIGTIGNAAIVKTDRTFSIKNVALFKTSENSFLDTRYLAYFIDSITNKDQFFLISKGGVQSFVSLTTLRNMKVVFPIKTEQKAIANYLDKACKKIDASKSLIEQQIETLRNYRKSLIHECVTGKKRVYFDE